MRCMVNGNLCDLHLANKVRVHALAVVCHNRMHAVIEVRKKNNNPTEKESEFCIMAKCGETAKAKTNHRQEKKLNNISYSLLAI